MTLVLPAPRGLPGTTEKGYVSRCMTAASAACLLGKNCARCPGSDEACVGGPGVGSAGLTSREETAGLHPADVAGLRKRQVPRPRRKDGPADELWVCGRSRRAQRGARLGNWAEGEVERTQKMPVLGSGAGDKETGVCGRSGGGAQPSEAWAGVDAQAGSAPSPRFVRGVLRAGELQARPGLETTAQLSRVVGV